MDTSFRIYHDRAAGISDTSNHIRRRSFILFFAVNPVYSALAGFFAGKQVKTFWWIPLLNALLFVCGAWLFFDLGESAFFIYASIYLALGLIAMIITALVIKKSADKRNAILEARKKRKES